MSDDNLDISWIQEYSRIHSVQQIMNREPMDDIAIQTIYLKPISDNNLKITKIKKENIQLTTINNSKCITKEQLIHIIREKTNIFDVKYKLIDSLLYTVDLEPKDIQKYVNGECNDIGVLTPISIENDIFIRPSLFIFHSLHSIVFLLEEIVAIPIKSIIKNTGQKPSGDGRKHTKKVRIVEPVREPGKMKKTRKYVEKGAVM